MSNHMRKYEQLPPETKALFAIELKIAKEQIPPGHRLIEHGKVCEFDLTWDFVGGRWEEAKPPLPMVKGQKRPGIGQITMIGTFVTDYVAVIRKN